MLSMGIPNEYQLDFSHIEDAKTLMEAFETRFAGNDSTKKSRKNYLNLQFETFEAKDGESIDGTFDRLRLFVSYLKLVGVTPSAEDVNLKFLRSLGAQWSMHTVVWRNKSDINTMTLENLYNDLKVYEIEVKMLSGSSSSSSTQNLTFVSSKSTSSSNDTSEYGNASTSCPIFGSSKNNISDAAVCAFLANLTTNTTIANQDLEHIDDDDDLEEIDLKWQMAMLIVRARWFLRRTGRTIKYNGQNTAGFDKSKIECYKYHMKGHFARECRSAKGNDSSKKNADEKKVTTAMVSCDGLGDYDWSNQAQEGPNLALMAEEGKGKGHNFALMAYASSSSGSDSEVSNESDVCVCVLLNHA